jgi:YfiH family protein
MVTGRALPDLARIQSDELAYFSDPGLAKRSGIRVVFSSRLGGASGPPYASLDLAAHTGDDPCDVDENRRRLAHVLGLDHTRFVTAEQVHGDRVGQVCEEDAGRGATTAEGSRPPVEGCDGLLTTASGIPLLMMYADCVPVVLVAEAPRRAVCVAHAGWKGALVGLPGTAASQLAVAADCAPADLVAYIGPHICSYHYEVSDGLACAFRDRYASSSRSVSILAAPPRVDLGAAVLASLEEAGLQPERVATTGMCTVEEPTLFYSYRAEGVTGRHGALVAIQA